MTQPHFACRLQRRAHEAIISVTGEFDYDQLEAFDEAAALVLTDRKVTTVRINCDSLSFLDCAALGALVRLQNQAEAAGKTVVLEGPPSAMKRLCMLTNTDIQIADRPELDAR